MKPRGQNFNCQAGWTLVELLVVLLVIAIIAALALMQRGNTNEQFKRQNIAWGLKNAFERARFDSVKRRPTNLDRDLYAYVTVGNTSYIMGTDRNSDGRLENNDPIATNFSIENITIQYLTGPSSANMPASVVLTHAANQLLWGRITRLSHRHFSFATARAKADVRRRIPTSFL
jgi:prepilin-type N-terminal cleavage/methylation domain-containing protein